MTDDAKPLPKRMTMLKITAKDFARFLDAKLGGADRCQVCGTDVWTIFCPGPDDIFRLGMNVRNQEKQFFVSTFAYHCDNCGYVRNHHAATVHKWVIENPESLSDDTEDSDSADFVEGAPDE